MTASVTASPTIRHLWAPTRSSCVTSAILMTLAAFGITLLAARHQANRLPAAIAAGAAGGVVAGSVWHALRMRSSQKPSPPATPPVEEITVRQRDGSERRCLVAKGRLPLPVIGLNRDVAARIEAFDYQVILDATQMNQLLLANTLAARETPESLPKTREICDHYQKQFPTLDLPKGLWTAGRYDEQQATQKLTNVSQRDSAAFQVLGSRRTQEDRPLIIRVFLPLLGGDQEAELTAVFDGHGGHECADHAVNTFVERLVTRVRQFREFDPIIALQNGLSLAFVDCSRSFNPEGGRATGTTANVALRWGNELWVANAGDSRAILVAPDGGFMACSTDHEPKGTFAEQVRDRGGIVSTEGEPAVLYLRHRLMMTRAFGDHYWQGAISPRPDITRYQMVPGSPFYLIQASDGVWGVGTNEEVAQLVQERLPLGADVAARDLVHTVNLISWEVRRDLQTKVNADVSADNVTVIITRVGT